MTVYVNATKYQQCVCVYFCLFVRFVGTSSFVGVYVRGSDFVLVITGLNVKIQYFCDVVYVKYKQCNLNL